MKSTFPWSETEPGGAFFVPSLNTERTRREGIVAAMHLGLRVKTQIGIYNKRYGVLFIRVKDKWDKVKAPPAETPPAPEQQ